MDAMEALTIAWTLIALGGAVNSVWLLIDTFGDHRRAVHDRAHDPRSLTHDRNRMIVIRFYFVQETLTLVAFLIFLVAGIDTYLDTTDHHWIVFGLFAAEVIFMAKTQGRRWYRRQLNRR